MGRCGSDRPARLRRMALATAVTASSWPTTRSCSTSSRRTSLAISPSMRRLTGHAGPPGHDLGDVLLVDLLLQHALAVGLQLVEAARWPPRPGARARGCGRSGSRRPARGRSRARASAAERLELLLELADARRWPPSRLPVGHHRVALLAAGWPAPRRARPGAPCDAASVSLASATRSISSWRMRRSTTSISVGIESISMRSRRRGLVDEVDGLVGQEAAGEVAVGQHGRGHQGRVLDAHAVVDLVALLEAAQDGDGVLDRGLARRTPAGTGARGRRPSRCACGTRRAWWRRSCAARRGPASA